jgi:hypothetical protein
LTRRSNHLFGKLLVAGAFAGVLTAQQPPTPYLFLRLITPRGIVTPVPGRPTEVANNQRIAFQICIRASTVADQLEQPQIQALNQHPDYFKNRPPANITLSVRRVTARGREDVPFRINSSGGGKDLAVHYVEADVDILEDKQVRLKRAEQFVEWMAAQSPGDSGSHLLLGAEGKGRLAAHFEEQYINNPPGDYEVIARYTPTTPQNWRGSLISAPFRMKVVDDGDFLDVLKTKLAPRIR